MSHLSWGCTDTRFAACPYSRCVLALGLDGAHLEHVDRHDDLLMVTASTPAAPTKRLSRGDVTAGYGRRGRVLHESARVQTVWQ